MARPRILLVPTVTEIEWQIKPLLEDWADVASFDAPGIGNEPPVDPLGPRAIVERGLAELDRRGWDRCVVVGDEYGTYGAIHIAAECRTSIAGLALGHACLSFRETGARAPVDAEVMGAMRQLSRVDYQTYVRHLSQVTRDAYNDEMADQYIQRVPRSVSAAYWGQRSRETLDESLEPLIEAIDAPLLFAKHEGCLSWTDAGWEDALKAFPEATAMKTVEKPGCSPAFGDALRDFCSGLD